VRGSRAVTSLLPAAFDDGDGDLLRAICVPNRIMITIARYMEVPVQDPSTRIPSRTWLRFIIPGRRKLMASLRA
jgi:hypothetical protein